MAIDEKLIVSNNDPKVAVESLPDKPFTVYIHVNAESGIEINADNNANFYAVIGAVEGARALLRCCVIDGYSHGKKKREQERTNEPTTSSDNLQR